MTNPKTYSTEEATRRLERYCAYQERCHKEVTQKLFEMRIKADERDEIIAYLIQNNFLNEGRFAQAFARGKFRTKKWGKSRIISELKFREISQYNIKLALKEIPDSDYYNEFDLLAQKRFDQLANEKDPQKKKRKFMDYLFYRGWESELVYGKLNELFS